MPQARLPDINTAFIKWRNKVVTSLESEKYTAVFGSLYSFNALLPEKYRVRISKAEYDEKLKEVGLFVVCEGCNAKSDWRQVNKTQRVLSPLVNLMSGALYEKIWICPSCDHDNPVSQTEKILNKPKEPYFLGVVPPPPERMEGITDRNTYHKKVESWAWQFMYELEKNVAQFRDDNWHKSDEMADAMQDIGYTGEETD